MTQIQQYFDKIRAEEQRNEQFLHLTANEPIMSDTARAFMSSKLADRYYFGPGENGLRDFGAFTALGFPGIGELVSAAEEAAKEMLGATVVNFNCLSGVHAMMCAILSTTEPGDVVMTVHHDHGGHFATKGIIDLVGRGHVFASYDFDKLTFDAQQIARDYQAANAKAFYMDVSYYLNPHNLRELRQALGDEAIIIYDASHTMGLIMGQQFQAPLKEGANVICANTHKTLPGPQKGMVAFRDQEFGEKASDLINSYLYSSPHTHSMIALATTILELKEFGEAYAKQVIANSNALGQALVDRGYEVRKANTGRYSENHQTHWLTEELGDRIELYFKFYRNHLAVNFDNPLGRGFFIRLGAQENTRRGMKEAEMVQIAEFLHQTIKGENIAEAVTKFASEYKQVHYSFDQR